MPAEQNKYNLEFLKKVLPFALPIILQNLLINGVSFVDTTMIGQLGGKAVAAVGMATQVSFIVTLFFFGLSSGCSIFVSQYWGAGNKHGIKQVIAFSLLISLIVSIPTALLSSSFAPKVMGIFTDDTQVITYGCDYLRMVAPSYICMGISLVLSLGLRSIGKPTLPLVVSAIALATDILGNYLLIFGIGPFPELGVKGAALATTISKVIELSAFVCYLLLHKDSPLWIDSPHYWIVPRDFAHKTFVRILPVIANETLWALGFSMYKVAFSRLGVEVMSAVPIIDGIFNLCTVAIFGLANATAILVGQQIGRKEPQKASDYAHAAIIFSLLLGCIIGGLNALAPYPLLPFFKVSDMVRQLVYESCIAVAFRMPLTAMDATIIIGILRSGGDTTKSMLYDVGTVWLFGVPIAFLGATVFSLELPILYALLSLEEIAKSILGLRRMKSEKWIHDLSTT